MIPLVIYHAGCWDGLGAAWAYFVNRGDAEFVSAHHGDLPPDVTGRDVFILDFSYPRYVMLEMKSVAASILVLDHHKTAEAALAGLDFCKFDQEHSGAVMAWMEFCKHANSAVSYIPRILEFIQDRDLWTWKLPRSKAINATIRSYPMTFESLDRLSQFTEGSLALEGEAILREQNRIIDGLVAVAAERPMGGHHILCVNATCFSSEVAGKLAVGRPFGAVWFEKPNGDRVYSLRSTPDVGLDVSEVAKQFGGGGHKHAAGFTIKASR